MEENQSVIPTQEKETQEVMKPTSQAVDKKFTQEEIDNIVVNRLAKERNKIFKKLGVEDESKLEEVLEKSKNYEAVKNENEKYKAEKQKNEKEKILRGLGIDEEFIDYAISKITDGENYAENAKTFVESNPKLKKDSFTSVKSSLELGGATLNADISNMTTEEYLKWRALYNLDGSKRK